MSDIKDFVGGAGGAVFVGCIVENPTDTVEDGFLACDHAEYSRTTYSDLFAKIGTRYGAGDGSTTFNVPERRGYFPRGWDGGSGNDPDVATRTDSGGGFTGASVGSVQQDEFKNHVGHHTTSKVTLDRTNLSIFTAKPYVGDADYGGNETRPKNVYVMYMIKY